LFRWWLGQDIFEVHFFVLLPGTVCLMTVEALHFGQVLEENNKLAVARFEVKNEAPLQRKIERARLKGTYA
jgi:hypothetical protein